MAKISFEVTQLPSPCSQNLLSNAETLAGKVINLTRVPTMEEVCHCKMHQLSASSLVKPKQDRLFEQTVN